MRIICNKKIDLTDDEWKVFRDICESYKEYGGESLFEGLFETDSNGIIQFLIPPSKQQTSLEIFLFLVSIFNHQHVREMERLNSEIIAETKSELNSLKEELKNILLSIDKRQ